MQIDLLVNGIYKENCYCLSEGKRAVVIDPGVDFGMIEKYLVENDLTVEMVLITHGHFDHCQCAHEFSNRGIKIFISRADYALAQESQKIPQFKPVFFEEEEAAFEGKNFKIVYTPGHTEGSVCIEFGGILFSGDTLFKNAIGRTDLPTGNYDKLKESLKMLSRLYEDIVVAPGHGTTTTIADERAFIEYL